MARGGVNLSFNFITTSEEPIECKDFRILINREGFICGLFKFSMFIVGKEGVGFFCVEFFSRVQLRPKQNNLRSTNHF